MTEEQQERLDEIIDNCDREHFYPDDGRSVARYTKTACGYAIWTFVTTNGDEQLDMNRAEGSLDSKEEAYLAKLFNWGTIK